MKRRFHLRLTALASTLLIFMVAVAFIWINAAMDSRKADIQRRIEQLEVDNEKLSDELTRLNAELEFVATDEGIELYARAQGMGKKGETRYSPAQ